MRSSAIHSQIHTRKYHKAAKAGSMCKFATSTKCMPFCLMIGGNIPGETRLISIAIYDYVEALQFEKAHTASGWLLVLSFLILICLVTYL